MAQEDRPPYVKFEQRAVEDRNRTIETGHYVAKDIDYAIITPVGSKDRIELVVLDWFSNLEQKVREERFSQTWLDGYKSSYKGWKEGLEIPVSGTPIRHWPGLSPAQYETLISLKVLTVEDLAQANEETLRYIGMGSHALKDRAKAYLETSSGDGKVAEANASLAQTVADQKARIETLEAANKQLTLQLDTLKPKDK